MAECCFSLMREKMNTKKLVLGFCVLVAVTGDFWGNEIAGEFVANAEKALLQKFGVWGALQAHVFAATGSDVLSDVPERQL
jgi:hypothetical protein